MVLCYISAGGNVGDVDATLDSAISLLEQSHGLRVLEESPRFGTPPMGENAGETRFRNSVIAIESDLSPIDLLDRLQDVENRLGRIREVRWGPRTIDLDIVLFGDLELRSERLVLPHPAAWHRRFVLDPLVEIAPRVLFPGMARTADELRTRLLPRPLPVAFSGNDATVVADFQAWARACFPEIAVVEAVAPAIDFWVSGPTASDESTVFRLDASTARNPRRFVQDVLTAALG